MRKFFPLIIAGVLMLAGYAHAGQFRIAIMQDELGAGKKYRPLETYLKGKGIEFSFIAAATYPDAAKMFASGQVDAMFSGSGIAGIFIIKDLASPLVRPVNKEGYSTYHAVVLAKKGSPKFTGNAEYFKGKKVVFTALASSGEIFFYSIPKIKSAGATVLKASSHGSAIEALSNGGAEVAIVKNHVWEKNKRNYPHLISVGEDDEENPDGTLIVSRKADPAVVSKVSSALLELKEDKSPQAQAALSELGATEFIKTTQADFKHTLQLLKAAGVDREFNFSF